MADKLVRQPTLTLAIGLVWIFSVFLAANSFLGAPRNSPTSNSCALNPYDELGFIHGGRYQPANLGCSPAEDYVERIARRKSWHELSKHGYWNNRTLLWVGDSVGRMLVDYTCSVLGHPAALVNGVSTSVTVDNDKYSKTASWQCYVPELGLRIVNIFFYGVGHYDEASLSLISSEWPPAPFNFEDRIDYAAHHVLSGITPDVVIVNGGLWDLKYRYRFDLFHRLSPASEHDRGFLASYRNRLRLLFDKLKERWPGSVMVWQALHELDQTLAERKVKIPWTKGLAIDQHQMLPDLFNKTKVSPLQQIGLQVAKEEEVKILDINRVWGQFDKSFLLYDGIHPSRFGRRLAVNMILEYLRWV